MEYHSRAGSGKIYIIDNLKWILKPSCLINRFWALISLQNYKKN